MELQDATFEGSEGGAGGDEFLFEEDSLQHNGRCKGIAMATVGEGDDMPPAWVLTVSERGGLGRQVVIDGIEF